MGFTKVLSNTNKKIRSTASAAGKTVVGTAATGVDLAATTAQAGVGLAANTAQLGAGLAVNTVGLGVGTVAAGVASGAALGVGTIGNGVHLLEGGLSAVTGISGGGVHGRRALGKVNEMEIYCSDLYTVDFVLEEFGKCKKAQIVDTLVIEDLLLRDDERLNKAAVNLVYKTTLEPKDEFDLEDDEVLPRTPYERPWKSMTFAECITTAQEYQVYSENKKEFQSSLRRVLKKRGVTKMPIRFTAKAEIAMLDMNEMIELLHEIEHDKTILDVQIPGICDDIRKLPTSLASHFDEETLDWKDDAEPVEIHIKYGSKPASKKKVKKRSTMLVRQCSLKLEHIVMSSSRFFDSDDDFDATGSASSMPLL